MTFPFKKASYATIAGLGLFVGAAGIAAAGSGNGTTPSPAPPAAVTPAADNTGDAVDGTEDNGINCEDGIDTATGAECDGGPAAALAEEATESPESEAGEKGTEATEATEADDGVNHEFEGEEKGNNGDGTPDADDAYEAPKTP